MKDSISKISIGIRYRRSFRVPSIAGEIVDFITQDKKSPFKEDFFEKTDAILENLENKGRILASEDQENSLSIDLDSFILNLKAEDFDATIKKIQDDIIPYIEKIFKEFKLKNINRVGIVFEFEPTRKDFVDKITEQVTQKTFTNPETFSLRFSEKETDMKSLVMEKLLDYVNYIVTIAKNKEVLRIKFDYQFYFSPEIASINDVNFKEFSDTAIRKLENKFLNWTKPNDEKSKKS